MSESQELDRVALEGEVIEPPAITVEDCVAEWATGAEQTIKGQLRQARAAYVAREQGTEFFGEFMQRAQVEKSAAYEYAKAWEGFGKAVENGELSGRVESGLVTISLLSECAHYEQPMKMLDAALDEGLSARAIKAKRRELQVPENVEIVKETHCPSCGAPSSAWERPPVEVS